MFKYIFFLSLFCLLSNDSYAQQNRRTDSFKMDSLKAVASIEQAALMYPRLRQFTITHEENGTGNISSKLYGKKFFDGRFRSSRTKINMNLPVLTRKNTNIVGNLGVIHQFFELSGINSFDERNRVENSSEYIPMLSAGLTLMHKDSLFGKPVTFLGSANAIFNPAMSRSQFSFMGMASIPLRQTPTSRLSAGAVVLYDPVSPVPFFLLINYFKHFEALKMDLMLDLPYRIALRRPVKKKTSITLYNELVGINSFYNFSKTLTSVPQNLTFSTLDIRSGLLGEYHLTKKAVVSLAAGINSPVNSRVRENNASPKNSFVKNRHQMVPFVQVGFSLLPFWKGIGL